jgi:thiol-disulfide isomerase/thioredoxin
MISLCLNSAYTQESPDVHPDVVLKDVSTWWNYNSHNIKLAEHYIPLDTSSKVISKENFLQFLATGEYIALRLKTVNSSLKYKLYKLNTDVDMGVSLQVRQFGKDQYKWYKMEGKEIPDFNFTDLNGNVYNRETTKGKIVVLKCWFIHCQPCIEEMPALNAIVKQHENKNDVVFISLAFDSKEELKSFLTKTKFSYAVIPVQRKYLDEKLSVNEYPTHFIVGKNGKIVKVVTAYRDMVSVLKHELSN